MSNYPIETLGQPTFDSPLQFGPADHPNFCFMSDEQKVIHNIGKYETDPSVCFEAAGPREKIFFDPKKTQVGIVACGGLCPGINNVIRTIVMQMTYNYGVKKVEGFRYGYQGLNPEYEHEVWELTPDRVKDIHNQGGSILASSRGPQDPKVIVKTLIDRKIDILFCIGGDGTLKGANAIAKEVQSQKLPISVIGIPKTIDNDILYCVKTFGFETAFSRAATFIQAAHTEAQGAPNCIVLVKLMGRDSGFIAANTVLACPDVNFVLVPEVPFDLEGSHGLLASVENFLVNKQQQKTHPHAVIVVAEGAGQHFFQEPTEKDHSGNKKYGDIGLFLKQQLSEHFKTRFPVSIKYIEPSYLIRSVPANAHDAIFCYYLADHAVHAAMAGKTNMMLGYWNGHFTHVPLEDVVQGRKKINPSGELWRQVLFATGQPHSLIDESL